MSTLLERLKKNIHFEEGMNSCMNCGVCTAICPAAEFYDYDPRRLADAVQRENEESIREQLRSEQLWY
ncbi:MAG: ferredoxin [Culturomica sp.]|nr:ferredoxin [Culturomica sp.]